MKTMIPIGLGAVLMAGCSAPNPEARMTNPNKPANNVGAAVGYGAGQVVGSVAGGVVGVGEGMVGATKEYFDTRGTATRVVRRWRTETTADGRTIQIPEDYLVDKDGRVIRKLTKN
jgi:hypothetical protein